MHWVEKISWKKITFHPRIRQFFFALNTFLVRLVRLERTKLKNRSWTFHLIMEEFVEENQVSYLRKNNKQQTRNPKRFNVGRVEKSCFLSRAIPCFEKCCISNDNSKIEINLEKFSNKMMKYCKFRYVIDSTTISIFMNDILSWTLSLYKVRVCQYDIFYKLRNTNALLIQVSIEVPTIHVQ